MFRISRYILIDILKNKVILGFAVLLIACGWGVFLLESQPQKALLILMQIVLVLLPVITVIFTAIYYYNSTEFITLMLSHPIGRFTIFKSFYICLVLAFITGFILGICLPLFIFYQGFQSLFLAVGGIFLIAIFTALGLAVGVRNKDKARGLGIVLLLWAFFAFIYDGILIYVMYQFSEYPIEKTVLFLTFFNPIDITRIMVIMKTEASAMLGLSGAVFQKFFGSSFGVLASLGALLGWSILPLISAWRGFLKKDF